MSRKTELDGAVLVRNRWSGAAALASLAVAIVALVCASFGLAFAVVGFYALIGLVIALALHLGWTRASRRLATITVDGGRVLASGAVVRQRVHAARVIPQPAGRGAIVELRRRFDPYPARVAVSSDEAARELVRALGLDPREGTTRFRTPFPTAPATAIGVGAILAYACVAPFLGAPLTIAAIVACVFGLVGSSFETVTIGRDGILFEIFPRRQFIPYTRIKSMRREVRENRNGPMVSRGFTLELESGEAVFVNTMRERMRDGMFAGDHLFDAAVAAHAAARAPRSDAADLLARGSRSTSEWLQQLDGARDARYRVAAISDDQLELVLANPNVEKTARVGAAICLARAGDEARAKVRIAVEDIAAPEVRKAALAALSDDEEALEAALDALDARP